MSIGADPGKGVMPTTPGRASPESEAAIRSLVIAEAANPEFVSVPLVGWSHYRALAERAEVHLVTQVRNRKAILRAGLQEGRDFTAIDSEALGRPLWRLSRWLRGSEGKAWTLATAFASLSYYDFERRVWLRFRDRLRAGEFDVVHRLTPLSPTAPSRMAGRCRKLGIPFVLGPLNGGLPWPRQFRSARHEEREWLSRVRGAYRLLPGYASTRRNAAAIMAGSRAAWSEIPARHRHKSIYLPENGIDPTLFALRARPAHGVPLRVAFVGRLVPYKGADMLLDAAAELARAGKLELDIIGDGPQMEKLRRQVGELGIGERVELAGFRPHAELQRRLVRSSVLGFPSIREFGGGVVLEAMALGLVPIVVDYGGPSELVTDATGYRIPLGTRSEIVARLRETLESLVRDPTPLRARSSLARRRAHECFSWSSKAEQSIEVYRWLLGRRSDRPDFGMPLPDPEPDSDSNSDSYAESLR